MKIFFLAQKMNYTNNFQYKIGASILRFLLGFFIFKDFVVYLTNKKFLFQKNGIVSYGLYSDIITYYNFSFLNFNFHSNWVIFLFLTTGLVFSFLFMLGIFQRFSVVVLFFLLLVFKMRNIYLLDGGDNVISVILPFYLFVNTYSYSKKYEEFKKIKAFKITIIESLISNYFAFAIMIQICIIYFFAGIHKLQGELWRDGTALYYILNSDDFSPTELNKSITNSLLVVKLITWFTILFQLTFPIMIWFNRTKKTYIYLGITLHLGIFLIMKIDNFSFVMISCYAIFFSNEYYEKNASFLYDKILKNK